MRPSTALALVFASLAAAVPYNPAGVTGGPTPVTATGTIRSTKTVQPTAGITASQNGTTAQSCSSSGTALNYALRIAQLQSTLHSEGLNKYSSSDLPGVQSLASSDVLNVKSLTSAVNAAGCSSLQACSYDFTYNSPNEFLALSSLVEDIAAAAYQSAIKQHPSTASSFKTLSISTSDVALDMDEVSSLLANFIDSCPPASNASLPVQIYSQLLPGPIDGQPSVEHMYDITFPPESIIQVGAPELYSLQKRSSMRRTNRQSQYYNPAHYGNYAYGSGSASAPIPTAAPNTAASLASASPSHSNANYSTPYSNNSLCAAFLTPSGFIKAPTTAKSSLSRSNSTAWNIQLPSGLNKGQNYFVLIPCSASTVCDSTILAGPAAIQIGGYSMGGGYGGTRSGSSNNGNGGSSGNGVGSGSNNGGSGGGNDGSSNNGGSSKHGGTPNQGGSNGNGSGHCSKPSCPPGTNTNKPTDYIHGTGYHRPTGTGYFPRPSSSNCTRTDWNSATRGTLTRTLTHSATATVYPGSYGNGTKNCTTLRYTTRSMPSGDSYVPSATAPRPRSNCTTSTSASGAVSSYPTASLPAPSSNCTTSTYASGAVPHSSSSVPTGGKPSYATGAVPSYATGALPSGKSLVGSGSSHNATTAPMTSTRYVYYGYTTITSTGPTPSPTWPAEYT